MQYTEERPSSGAIARRKTGVFDALCRRLLPQAGEGKVWRRPGVDATARIVDFVIALDAGKRWALAKGEGSHSMRARERRLQSPTVGVWIMRSATSLALGVTLMAMSPAFAAGHTVT